MDLFCLTQGFPVMSRNSRKDIVGTCQFPQNGYSSTKSKATLEDLQSWSHSSGDKEPEKETGSVRLLSDHLAFQVESLRMPLPAPKGASVPGSAVQMRIKLELMRSQPQCTFGSHTCSCCRETCLLLPPCWSLETVSSCYPQGLGSWG